MPSTYISPFDFARSPSGLEYASLVGNMVRFAGAASAGATSITIFSPGLTVALNPYDQIYIFDQLNSEIAIVTAAATTGATTIQCQALQFAHAVGTPICSDGVLGSLGTVIFSSGQWLETICHQSLYVSTYTNEQLAIPTMRASIDNQYALHFRPRHWPITALSSVAVTIIVGNTVNYDPAQVIIDSDRQICSIPNLQPLPPMGSGQAPYPIWNVSNRYREGQLTITYNSGFSPLPNDVTEAAILLASDVIAKRENPIGALEVSSGNRHISAAIRGDTSGDTILFKRAKKILDNYTVQSF